MKQLIRNMDNGRFTSADKEMQGRGIKAFLIWWSIIPAISMSGFRGKSPQTIHIMIITSGAKSLMILCQIWRICMGDVLEVISIICISIPDSSRIWIGKIPGCVRIFTNDEFLIHEGIGDFEWMSLIWSERFRIRTLRKWSSSAWISAGNGQGDIREKDL